MYWTKNTTLQTLSNVRSRETVVNNLFPLNQHLKRKSRTVLKRTLHIILEYKHNMNVKTFTKVCT